MPDYSQMDFLLAPDEAQARAIAESRRKALRRRQPAALGLALAPDPAMQRLGREMLGEGPAEERRLGELAEARQMEAHRRTQEQLQRWGLQQGRWVPVVKTDPVTGESFAILVDTRTGQVRPLGGGGSARPPALLPSHTPRGPAQLPPLPPMKLSETQAKVAGAAGGVVDAMRNALDVGFPTTGARGLPQALGQQMVMRGFPGLASKEAQQTYAAWYNVIRPLVNIRTGQQMAVQELVREFNALAPIPGQAPETMLRNVRLLPQLMRRYTVGLPRPLAERLNAEYDQVEAMLPQSVEDIVRRQATGEMPGAAEAPATGRLGGRRVIRR